MLEARANQAEDARFRELGLVPKALECPFVFDKQFRKRATRQKIADAGVPPTNGVLLANEQSAA
jgi:hypothetical protein